LSGQLLTRMRTDVIALKPSAVVIQGGTFDLARGVSLPTIEDNLTSIADVAASNNIKLVFASLLPVSEVHKERPQASLRALNDWMKVFCTRRACTYVDFFTPLSDAQGMLLADVSDDGLHPNSKGYRLMAPILGQAIEQATRPAATSVKPQRQK